MMNQNKNGGIIEPMMIYELQWFDFSLMRMACQGAALAFLPEGIATSVLASWVWSWPNVSYLTLLGTQVHVALSQGKVVGGIMQDGHKVTQVWSATPRKGIGRSLLDHARTHANGAHLTIVKPRKNAQAFYTKVNA